MRDSGMEYMVEAGISNLESLTEGFCVNFAWNLGVIKYVVEN